MTDSGAKLAIATIIRATNKAILFFISNTILPYQAILPKRGRFSLLIGNDRSRRHRRSRWRTGGHRTIGKRLLHQHHVALP